MVPVLENARERSMTENYCPVIVFLKLLWLVKSLKNSSILGLLSRGES